MRENDSVIYSETKKNQIIIKKDFYDYEVFINNDMIITTGDETEAEIVAEAISATLAILNARGKLK